MVVGARKALRCLTRSIIARTGQSTWWPERPSPTISPLTPFFCVVNTRPIYVVASRLASVQV